MLMTNPTVRATLAEVLSHPWMVLGFTGPPNPYMLQREPLRPDELDRQVVQCMTGLDFGSDQDIEKNLVAILESEEYIRAVHHWERQRSVGDDFNGHGKEGTRWGDLPNSKSSVSLSSDGNTSSRGDHPTPSKESGRFSGLDSKLSSIPTNPVNPMVHSPSNSENRLSYPSLNKPNREPLDPTSGYHPLLSMYYLAREKLERDRVYGPGQFASSQMPLQDPSDAAVSITRSEGLGDSYSSSSTSGVDIHNKREPEPPPPTGSKADYNREPLLHSGMSYDNANANGWASDLSWQEQDQTEAKKEKDARGKEELRRNEEEARRKEQEAKLKEQEVRRKEEEAKVKEEELRKKYGDVRKREEDVRRREEDVRKREEDVTKHEEDVTQREKDVIKREEDVKKRKEDVRKREEDVRICEEDVRKCEEDVRKCEEDVKKCAEEAQQKERCARLYSILQVSESFKKLVCLQDHQAQEMMDLLQKVRLPFVDQHHVHLACPNYFDLC